MTDGNLTIGCAGAGILGSAIIRRLLKCGFSVGVWNRDRAKLSPLVDLGATPADTPTDLARGRDVVLTCVTGGEAVEAIVFSADGVAASGAPEKLLIDMSTSDASHTRDPVTAIVAERYRKMIGDGLGGRDCSELVTLYRALE